MSNKKIKRMICIATALMLTFCMTGCKKLLNAYLGIEDYLPEYEDEYFRYAVRTLKKDSRESEKECYIIGFTELGAAQTELILPSEYDGIPVVDLGYRRKVAAMIYEDVGEFYSDTLKKLYIPFAVDESTWKGVCNGYFAIEAYLVRWRNLVKRYYFGSAGSIIGYNLLSQFLSAQVLNDDSRLANVSYMYNFEGAQDDGYYWVDSYDNDLVTFIPPEPTREGFTFVGWYKEKECINEWDFEQDKTGAEIVISAYSTFEKYDNCEITNIYAKWEKI